MAWRERAAELISWGDNRQHLLRIVAVWLVIVVAGAIAAAWVLWS